MAVSRKALFGKLNTTLFRAVESAAAFARLRGNPYVELVHWLHQLWQLPNTDMHRVAHHFGIQPGEVDAGLVRALAALPNGATSLSDISYHVSDAVERAWVVASVEFGADRIRSVWLLLALLQSEERRTRLLRIVPAFSRIDVDRLVKERSTIVEASSEARDGTSDGMGRESEVAFGAPTGDPTSSTSSALTRYCSDLTARARAGQIDPVIGRQVEVRGLVDILLRRRQNNPLLTGEAGVGKTAIVEGLALAIDREEVPPALRDHRLLAVDIGAMLAGAGVRGEFEGRLKGLLEDASRAVPPVILFIDEVHTLVGAGGQAGTGDAANLLKPALARGHLRTIGATTWAEYKRHIEKDPALTRRFQVLQVAEPEEGPAVDMLRGSSKAFAAHHGVLIMDEAVRAAVALSRRYLPARQLPDKAISLLDTACARVAMSIHAPPATVELARHRVAALEVEFELLQRQAVLGIGGGATAECAHAVQTRLAEARDQLTMHTSKWGAQVERIRRVVALRQQLLDGCADAVVHASPAAPQVVAELSALESELAADAQLGRAQVDEAAVAEVLADWTGIPVGRMVSDDVKAVARLRARLAERVVGQDHALSVIADRVQAAKAGLTDADKPVGVFMLVGPSGVGKTETALALADALYGGAQNMVTINMSEFQEAHTVSTLKGAPPGYVGYGEGGVLTEAVRRRPYSVVLLDEVEKAHPDVHELFFQVFDKGWMEDGEGRRIDFRNCLILLTSNAGADVLVDVVERHGPDADVAFMADSLMPALREVFPAAFLGRLAVVPYHPLQTTALSTRELPPHRWRRPAGRPCARRAALGSSSAAGTRGRRCA